MSVKNRHPAGSQTPSSCDGSVHGFPNLAEVIRVLLENLLILAIGVADSGSEVGEDGIPGVRLE